MKKVMSVIVIILFIAITFSGCESKGGMALHETPQTYVLSGSEYPTFITPTLVLYANGNAEIPWRFFSNRMLIGTGRYKLSGNELTVTHEEIEITFTVSDGGDTLTVKSETGSYEEIGTVYNYRAHADYLENYKIVDGEKMTIDILRELAEKAQDLHFSDFDQYVYAEIDPDYRLFDIGDEYRVAVIYTADGDTTCTVLRKSSGESFPLQLNGSTGLLFDKYLGVTSVPHYQPQKWVDYYRDDTMPWGESRELALPEFPGVTFTWTPGKVTANGKDLFSGMPVWNVFLADLTNDGKPELCATVSFGSGIVDTRVIVYDYSADKTYTLQDRMQYDYFLSIDDGTMQIGKGKLVVSKIGYSDALDYSQHTTTALTLVRGEIFKP